MRLVSGPALRKLLSSSNSSGCANGGNFAVVRFMAGNTERGGSNEEAGTKPKNSSVAGQSGTNPSRKTEQFYRPTKQSSSSIYSDYRMESSETLDHRKSELAKGPITRQDYMYAMNEENQRNADLPIYRGSLKASAETRDDRDIPDGKTHTWRDETGQISEKRRDKEHETSGFPEYFKPVSKKQKIEPIPKLTDEMHNPSRDEPVEKGYVSDKNDITRNL